MHSPSPQLRLTATKCPRHLIASRKEVVSTFGCWQDESDRLQQGLRLRRIQLRHNERLDANDVQHRYLVEPRWNFRYRILNRTRDQEKRSCEQGHLRMFYVESFAIARVHAKRNKWYSS